MAIKLKKGKEYNFATIEDMNAFTSGLISYEEAQEKFEARKTESLGTMVVTKIDHENKSVTIDVRPKENK